jgi:hypothetical protein
VATKRSALPTFSTITLTLDSPAVAASLEVADPLASEDSGSYPICGLSLAASDLSFRWRTSTVGWELRLGGF